MKKDAVEPAAVPDEPDFYTVDGAGGHLTRYRMLYMVGAVAAGVLSAVSLISTFVMGFSGVDDAGNPNPYVVGMLGFVIFAAIATVLAGISNG